ncbi:hypothetical protein Y71_16990 [Kosakonia radicincitans DSM 16656]|uniref:hypothetical protein n=1 Tax=Kosakonia radicincitans TaxID=283686 RepID=UPI0009BC9E30|nr:hypothetical protein [Kosakonia radicincitans]ARD61539.1 hypothetical protein Y71_16990 [Kosakonia radicincitans DSM 16656]
MFGIFTLGEPTNMEDELVQPSSIIINDFKEKLYLPLAYWDVETYKRNWLNSLEEGFYKKNHSALAVSMYEPSKVNFIFTWVLYYEGQNVYVQNNVIFLDKCDKFIPENINEFIELRAIYDEDGMKISEWVTDMKSVLGFFYSLHGLK